jgi:GNAT superfamily N-acetyltransferase
MGPTMAQKSPEPPAGLRLDVDPAPSADIRAALARELNAFHSRSFPYESERFALLLRDDAGGLAAGVIGVVAWEWLFIEAVWVADALRGQGVGRMLMDRAEAQGLARGCGAVWLDTFQARDFYHALGYETFGALEDYPAGQTRYFMRKALVPAASD